MKCETYDTCIPKPCGRSVDDEGKEFETIRGVFQNQVCKRAKELWNSEYSV